MSETLFSQPSAEELRKNAYASLEKARKKGKVYEPVVVENMRGSICTTWWGKSWCENLEQYADYGSRLQRGRRYVREGTVLDLKIEEGAVHAKVQGSRSTPYSVEIHVKPLSERKKKLILKECSAKIESLADLANGKFPEEMKDLFLSKDGLFPSPREISFDCSCPDWANMCKHVAAVMYGIGIRLDKNPFYFFILRSIDVDAFIQKSVNDKVETMLRNAHKKSKRIMDDKDLEIFGVL